MTPWQFSLLLKSRGDEETLHQRKRAWAVWHIAALGRCEKLPSYDSFVGGKDDQQDTAEKLKRDLKTHLPIGRKKKA